MNIEKYINIKKALERFKNNKLEENDVDIILNYIETLENEYYRVNKAVKILTKNCSYHEADYDFNK